MFLSTDPVQGIRFNPYIYAGANPTNYVDPNGEWFWFALALGIPIITGITAAAYDVTTTQGVGLGGHNQGDLSAINLNQTAFAAVTGFFGGTEALASTVLWPVYLAHGLINGLSPYEVNRNLLANIGLDDEYDAVRQSPYYAAGKTGGDVGVFAASVTSLARSLNNLSFSTRVVKYNLPYPVFNGLGQFAYATGNVSIPVVAGAGALVVPGYTAIGSTISFFSSSGRGGGKKGSFELPSTVRRGGGVKGQFSDSRYNYRIDTNRVGVDEGGFHIHIYEGRTEIAKVNGKGGWQLRHGGRLLPRRPSEVPRSLRDEINQLVRHVRNNL